MIIFFKFIFIYVRICMSECSGSPETGVHNCELSCSSWELNPSPLEEQPVLLPLRYLFSPCHFLTDRPFLPLFLNITLVRLRVPFVFLEFLSMTTRVTLLSQILSPAHSEVSRGFLSLAPALHTLTPCTWVTRLHHSIPFF